VEESQDLVGEGVGEATALLARQRQAAEQRGTGELHRQPPLLVGEVARRLEVADLVPVEISASSSRSPRAISMVSPAYGTPKRGGGFGKFLLFLDSTYSFFLPLTSRAINSKSNADTATHGHHELLRRRSGCLVNPFTSPATNVCPPITFRDAPSSEN